MTMHIFKLLNLVMGLSTLLLSAGAGFAGVWPSREAALLLSVPANPPDQTYALQNTFASLTFSRPVGMATPTGETNRLFVIERSGSIRVITNLTNPTSTLFLDLAASVATGSDQGNEQGLLGLAFHPGYETNGFFFVTYTSSSNSIRFDRLSRFQVSTTNANSAQRSSEVILINQSDDAGNHNAGDLHFGTDGYLYMSLGDEGGGDDQFQNSQRLDKDFFSGILRLDVDKRPGNLPANPHPAASTNYLVPADNPFIGRTTFNGRNFAASAVRTEFWAVGLRNPWRMSFDSLTGQLWVGDVGQGTREEVDIITRGGNYGWNFREGMIARPGSSAPPASFSAINPVHDYPRGDGYSIIGGLICRNPSLSDLYGTYIFGDYGSGNIWSLRVGSNGTVRRKIAVNQNISAFGVDPSNGEILVCDIGAQRIKRLVRTGASTGAPLPPTLSATGVFADLTNLTVNPGILPYSINAPFWSDLALKKRWFSVPDANQLITFQPNTPWQFPTGTIWIKHFEIEMTNGVPGSTRRLETRLLVRNTNGLHGMTYRWGDSHTNATLVAEEGFDETLTIYNQDGTPLRQQSWHYPGRTECLSCHTAAAGWALGFNTQQLARGHDYGGGLVPQLSALAKAGYFNAPLPSEFLHNSYAPIDDESVSIEHRVRSYLSVNCAGCHQPGGGGGGSMDFRLATPFLNAGILNGALNAPGTDPATRVVVPNDLEHSMIFQRIANLGPGHMPPIGTSVLNSNAVAVVAQWITNALPALETYAQWQMRWFGDTNAPSASPSANPDDDTLANAAEYLLYRDPTHLSAPWNIHMAFRTGGLGTANVTYQREKNRLFQVEWTDSLEEGSVWKPLDAPENAPFFSAISSLFTVPDREPIDHVRYYRVRVTEE